MKKLLFTAWFLASATLLIGQQGPFADDKEQHLKSKIIDTSFIFLTDKQRLFKWYLINQCLNGNLSEAGSIECSQLKNILLDKNDSSIPLEEKTLKRRLLDYISPFRQDERSAIDYMTNVVDKNIERAKIRAELEKQGSSLKYKVINELADIGYGWLGYIGYANENTNEYCSNIYKCLYEAIHDKDTMDQCLKTKEFIKNHTPMLDSNDKQRIAQILIHVIDTNMAYNKKKIAYENSLKDLYTQD